MIDETYTRKHSFSADRRAAAALVIIVMVLLLLGGRHFEKLSNHSYLQDLRLSETLELIEIREKLELYIFGHFLQVEKLASFIKSNPDMTQEEFAVVAARLQESMPDIINFEAAQGLTVSHVYPYAENKHLIGLNFAEYPTLLKYADRVSAKKTALLTGPVKAPSGEYLVFFKTPIFLPSSDGGATEEFWGFATVVVRLDDMLGQTGFRELAETADYVILSENDDLSEPQVVAGNPGIQGRDPVSLDVDFPNGAWEVLATPKGGWPETAPTLVRDRLILLMISLVCLSILGYILYISRANRRARARLAGAINAMDDGFAQFDSEQRLVKYNKRYASFLSGVSDILRHGVTLTELLEEGLKRGNFVDAFGQEEAWYKERKKEIDSAQAKKEMRFSNGLTVHAAIQKTSDGGSVVILSDVTQLKNALERSQAASEAKSQFISVLSHELRTPLTVVLGLAKLTHEIERQPAYVALETALHKDPVDVEECRKAMRGLADHIKSVTGKQTNSASYLLELINEMLDFSKIESGNPDIDMTECEIGDLVTTVEQQMRRLIEDKHLELVVEYEDGKVLADCKRTRQILTNLLGNAAKFTERGFIALTVTHKEGEVHFNVEDSGPGIEEADRQRIFEPFEQVDSSLTRSKTGTGLGLAISRKLARAQSGDLLVESTPGKGSLFTLVLKPVESREEQASLSA